MATEPRQLTGKVVHGVIILDEPCTLEDGTIVRVTPEENKTKKAKTKVTDDMIKAHCVNQEYWFIRRNRCSCGGTLKSGMQGVGPYLDTIADRISTTCQSCGQSRNFIFEISSFYGHINETMEVFRALSNLSDKQLKDKILKMADPPMENTTGYILELGEAGDMLALDYLQEAIEYARKKTQSN